ncbi:uncharacterized protein VP01_5682g1, partial [Puccinia sorghi]
DPLMNIFISIIRKASPKPTKPTTQKPAIQRKSKKNRGKNSFENNPADKTEGHLKKEDYLVIIKWLKIERNYNSCFGTGKAPAVGHPAKGKINGFEMMAINLRNQSPSKINLTPHQMKYQFNTYKDKYKKVHTKSRATGSTGFGREFINPCFKVDAQAGKKTASSTSEPAGNEIRSSDMKSNNDYVCISTIFLNINWS